MGRIATSQADLTIITSDNPRSENPLDIIADIQKGIVSGAYEIEPDREAAIRLALSRAQKGDIVIICGKGHEDYQEFAGGHRIHFDDREVAARVLEELGGA